MHPPPPPPRQDANTPDPAYQRIKAYVLEKIRRGNWKQGDAIPTEQALCRIFKVSRMTVNRAMRELAADQVLIRRKGSGTYVAPPRPQAALIDMSAMARDAGTRGGRHAIQVLSLDTAGADAAQSGRFGLACGAPLFHSLIVHREDGMPVQLDDRWVNAALAPAYLDQNWGATCPDDYLAHVAPMPHGSCAVEIRPPAAGVAQALEIGDDQPCLVVERTAFSSGVFVSETVLWHPGNRCRLAGTY